LQSRVVDKFIFASSARGCLTGARRFSRSGAVLLSPRGGKTDESVSAQMTDAWRKAGMVGGAVSNSVLHVH